MSENSVVGRNEPCPCKSGKKYKRCCGVHAAPKLSQPTVGNPNPEGVNPGQEGNPAYPGFDPSSFDPQMMLQMSQALQRLPKGQLQRLQGLMQKAMSGRDVRQEAAELERSLPPDFQNLMMSFASQLNPEASQAVEPSESGSLPLPASLGQNVPSYSTPGGTTQDMSVDRAKEIIAQAMSEGKLSAEEGEKLLSVPAPEAGPKPESGMGQLWNKLRGRKETPSR